MILGKFEWVPFEKQGPLRHLHLAN